MKDIGQSTGQYFRLQSHLGLAVRWFLYAHEYDEQNKWLLINAVLTGVWGINECIACLLFSFLLFMLCANNNRVHTRIIYQRKLLLHYFHYFQHLPLLLCCQWMAAIKKKTNTHHTYAGVNQWRVKFDATFRNIDFPIWTFYRFCSLVFFFSRGKVTCQFN